jgi:hypothetical protein
MALVTLLVFLFSDSEDFRRHVVFIAYISMEVTCACPTLNRGCESKICDFNIKLTIEHDIFGF